MALHQTIEKMKEYLSHIDKDLDKGMKGNKAAAQRARTLSIRFAKIAKLFRKESIAWEKSGGAKAKKSSAKKTTTKPAKKVSKKKAVNKTAKRRASAKKAVSRRTAKRKTTARRPSSKRRAARR